MGDKQDHPDKKAGAVELEMGKLEDREEELAIMSGEKDGLDEMNLERERLAAREEEISTLLGDGAKVAEDLNRNMVLSEEMGGGQSLVPFMEKLVKEKEARLMCPGCGKAAGPPIYMCSDGHLICSVCIDKVDHTVPMFMVA